MKIGCHISVAKGLEKAAMQAVHLGAQSFQVFTKNPRGLKPKKIDHKDADKGVEIMTKHDITLVCHTPYITNLSTPKEDLQEVTIRSIVEDLHIAEAYGAVGAVVHCGKHVGEGEEYGTKRMVETLDLILEQYNGPVKLLLENTAGQGTELGLTIRALVEIRKASKYPEKIGYCFDTCHAFAAGQWDEETFDKLLEDMEQTGYLDNLICIHFNDSKVPYGSRKDRHEKIGKGEIGSDALAKFLRSEKLQHLPVVLETPVDDEQEYAEEMVYVRNLQG
ncbi:MULTISPECIES: deoxyribonuclease IV [Brevibacillus]|uniref:Probable endonuclease 4 n=1 Tax=Brevibacillus laterosporus TaxID=1465 RepID=A0AAP8QD12_BRELA|nr:MULTISPECIES: deoxyribonuclease IV [Brevibacillus]ATO48174.1 endonuclease IV [Brevibacillus laterosporus DSM 25]AYB37050.1 deoxyribonuclease IV [Brevibacillus laterosporus]MBG9772511.1 endonuclease IV [Brevibacillus laterosporus]MBG9799918.1 endonuclease IV [Brevibacillus laterosporus]MBG9801838.1 endonuclease IV [Brevibacillus laterosporus]